MRASYQNIQQIDDNELLGLLSCGEGTSAIREIYRRYWEKLLVTAYNHLKNKEEAEEIVQDVLLSLWNRRHHLAIDSLNSYLATAAKYKVFTYLRKKQQAYALFEKPGVYDTEYANSDHEEIYTLFMEQEIDGIVDTLPEKCKLVFTYSRREGNSIKEIAQKMGIAEKTVEAHLTKALKTLRISWKHLGLFILFHLLG